MIKGRLVCGVLAVCAGMAGAVPVTDGLILQLNADSRATSLVEESGAVAVWRDVSGNGNDVAQGVAGNRPVFVEQGINGRGCVRFAGSAWLTNLTDLVDYSTHTLFVVSRRESAIAMDTVGSGGTGAGHILYMYLSSGNGLRTHYWGKGVVADLPEMTNDLIYAQRLGGGTAHIWESGLLFFSGASGTSAAVKKGFVLGSRQAATPEPRLRGLVGEVLLYNRALTDAEVKQVNAWLVDRWGALPESFATTAPVTNGLMVNVSAGAGVMKDTSGKIQLWADLSGHANHLIQGAASYRPTPVTENGIAKVRFSGGQSVSATSALSYSNHTVLAVVQTEAFDYGRDIFGSGAMIQEGQTLIMTASQSTPGDSFNAMYWVDAVHNNRRDLLAMIAGGGASRVMVEIRQSDSAYEMFQNGIGSAAKIDSGFRSPLVRDFVVGSRSNPPVTGSGQYPFVGTVSEVLVYNRALSQLEMWATERYLADKWGLSIPERVSPPVTSGLRLFCDAMSPSAVSTNASGLVQSWSDFSGNALDLSQTTLANRPRYVKEGLQTGKPALVFNGTNVLFSAQAPICYSNHTVIVLGQARDLYCSDVIGSGGTSEGHILLMNYRNTIKGHFWGNPLTMLSGPAYSGSVHPTVYAQRMTTNRLEVFRGTTLENYTAFSGVPSALKKGVYLGSRQNPPVTFADAMGFIGEVSSVLVYDRALSDEEYSQTVTWLTERWMKDTRPTLIRLR